jgi:hypothetical protein
MPRRAAAGRRTIDPDPVHRSKLVQQVINKVMLDGKKSTAERIVYDALAIMPGWLKVVAHVNPLTYEVEGLRSFLLGGGHPLLDLLVCLGWLGVLAVVATSAYPRALL